MKVIVDKEFCSKCNTCATVCLMQIIQKATDHSFPEIRVGSEDYCLKCGHCESFCPNMALSLDFMTEEKGMAKVPDNNVDPLELASFMKMRRSVRHFNSKPVSKELILKAIDICRYAPSGGNGQPVKWHVVYESQDVRKIAEMTIDWMRTLVNTDHPLSAYVPVILSIWESGVEYICHNAPHLIIAHLPDNEPTNDNTDATIAMTYFDLAAPLVGFSTCWAGFVSMAAVEYKPLKEFIKLPDGRRFAFAMLFGYSKFKITSIPRRNKADVTWK
jgi:nitroreductase/Pyruvate/2-oxoacid:ferredoxin oxidoreductase delta subunit